MIKSIKKTGLALMLVLFMALSLLLPASISAAPGVLDWSVVSPDSWIVHPQGGSGLMHGGEQTDSVVFDGDLFIAGRSYSIDTTLWRYDLNGTKTWSNVVPEVASGTYTITSLHATDSLLYATTGGLFETQLWVYDGANWEADEDFSDIGLESTLSVVSYNGQPCVSGWRENNPHVYCKVAGNWTDTDIAEAGADSPAVSTNDMTVANGKIYINFRDSGEQYADLFAYDGTTWSKVATPYTENEGAWGLLDLIADSEGNLVASFSNFNDTANVYWLSDDEWTKLGVDNFGDADGFNYAKLALFQDKVVVGATAYNDLSPHVYQWSGGSWDIKTNDWFGTNVDNEPEFYPTVIRTLTSSSNQIFAGTAVPDEGDSYNQVWASAAPADMNNDGIPDSQQANVSSYTNSITGKTVVIELDETCDITKDDTVTESSLPAQDEAYDYTNGLFDFTADCEVESTSVRLFYYDVQKDDLVLRKFNPNSNTYYDISGASIEEQAINGHNVTIATYEITDGGELDMDGEQDGSIADPAGLGIRTATNTTNLANTGQSTSLFALLGLLLAASSISMLYASSRTRQI